MGKYNVKTTGNGYGLHGLEGVQTLTHNPIATVNIRKQTDKIRNTKTKK